MRLSSGRVGSMSERLGGRRPRLCPDCWRCRTSPRHTAVSTRRRHFVTAQTPPTTFLPCRGRRLHLSPCFCLSVYNVSASTLSLDLSGFLFRRLYLVFFFPTTFHMTPFIGAQMSVLYYCFTRPTLENHACYFGVLKSLKDTFILVVHQDL